MRESILVIGGTGALGAPVARHLVSAGYHVAVLTRDPTLGKAPPNVTLVRGDVDDRASLLAAMQGRAGVHISLHGGNDAAAIERVEHEGTARAASAAAESNIRRIVYVSGMYAGQPFANAASEVAKSRAAEAIRRCGVPFVILKPTFFMETLQQHVRGKRAVIIGRQPHPLHMIAASDFAAMAERAFRLPETQSHELFAFGPEAIPLPDALRRYIEIVRPDLRLSVTPLPLMRVINRLFMRGELSRTIHLMKTMQTHGEVGDGAPAHAILGRPVTTLDAWCAARAKEKS